MGVGEEHHRSLLLLRGPGEREWKRGSCDTCRPMNGVYVAEH